ncbi:hypothetical protein [Streptomyces uncialis]|uniref:hypothetical protein n=1 Tax=Streptomyces uncialis TaxID=1048205 RepID=UPI003797C3B5
MNRDQRVARYINMRKSPTLRSPSRGDRALARVTTELAAIEAEVGGRQGDAADAIRATLARIQAAIEQPES